MWSSGSSGKLCGKSGAVRCRLTGTESTTANKDWWLNPGRSPMAAPASHVRSRAEQTLSIAPRVTAALTFGTWLRQCTKTRRHRYQILLFISILYMTLYMCCYYTYYLYRTRVVPTSFVSSLYSSNLFISFHTRRLRPDPDIAPHRRHVPTTSHFTRPSMDHDGGATADFSLVARARASCFLHPIHPEVFRFLFQVPTKNPPHKNFQLQLQLHPLLIHHTPIRWRWRSPRI